MSVRSEEPSRHVYPKPVGPSPSAVLRLEAVGRAGHHVLALQRRGFTVTGIDNSPRTADVARQRGCHDIRVLSLWGIGELNQTFRTVLMLGNNAGLPGTVEAVGRFLALLRAYTEPDAVLVAQSIDPADTENPQHLGYHQRNERAGRYKCEMRLREEYGGRVSPWWNLVLMEPSVLHGCCKQAGWEVEDLIAARPSYYLIARRRDTAQERDGAGGAQECS